MNKRLRAFSIIVALITCVVLGGITVSAASYGDYSYKSTLDGVVITSYSGKAADLTIPDKINGKPVVEIGDEAFEGKLCLETVTIPSTVKRIGKYAFETCGKLKTVNLPSSLNSIGYAAFSGCANLRNLTLPNGLKRIEACAFYCCKEIKTLNLPASVDTIGYSAFSGCGLKELNIPNDTELTELGDRVFYRSFFKTVSIPASIKKLGKECFAENGELESISVEYVEEIGDSCFDECGDPGDVNPPLVLSAKVIGTKAFGGYVINSLTLNEGVKSIGYAAFNISRPNGATDVVLNLPSTVNNIEGGAFTNCDIDKFTITSGNSSYIATADGCIYTADGKKLVAVPQNYQGEFTFAAGTTEIGSYAFSTIMNITSMTIPDTVSKLDDYAFKSALFDNMELLVIPSTVTNIGKEAFKEMRIDKLTINAPIETLDENSFMNATVNQLTLPSTLTTIKKDAFFDAKVNTTLPKSLTNIEDGAFLRYKGMLSIEDGGAVSLVDNNYIVKNNTELMSYITQGDSTITEITIPDGIKTIHPYAVVSKSYGIKVINAPSSVEEVGDYGMGFVNPEANILYYDMKFPDTNVVIYSSSEAILDYARTNAISGFSGEASQNITSVSLAGGETASFIINNARAEDVAYTSGDKKIATVDQNGVITAQRKGTVSIVATVGHTNFECMVTVTSDSSNPYVPEFDESKYHAVSYADYQEWYETYAEYNKGNLPSNTTEAVYIGRYKGESPSYYKVINAAESMDPLYVSRMNQMFGEGFEETALLMSHGLENELKNYSFNEDLVLYTGTKELNIVTGNTPNIPYLISIEGNEYTFPMTTSTSLDQSVACGFGDYIAIIYADKEAIGGGYIENLFNPQMGGEYEVLLYKNFKVKVLEAGVRHIQAESLHDGRTKEKFERYIKLYLSAGDEPQKKVDTGDGNNIELYLIVGLFALVMLTILIQQRASRPQK